MDLLCMEDFEFRKGFRYKHIGTIGACEGNEFRIRNVDLIYKDTWISVIRRSHAEFDVADLCKQTVKVEIL